MDIPFENFTRYLRNILSQLFFFIDTGFPWTLNATSGQNGSMSDALVWKSSRWANGAGNQYPVSRRGVSSYAVIDQMIKYFDNQTLYPNLRQIVVAGHSLGAQFVNRYASVGDSLGTTGKRNGRVIE